LVGCPDLTTKIFLPLVLSVIVAADESPWARHTVDDASQGTDGVRLGGVNGDGLADIATAWEEGGVVRVAVHPGNADVRTPVWAAEPTPETTMSGAWVVWTGQSRVCFSGTWSAVKQ
jgi:hypothetical protein